MKRHIDSAPTQRARANTATSAVLVLVVAAGLVLSNTPSLADVVISGSVRLPAAKAGAASAARYQQKSGTVAAPEPPTAIVFLEGSLESGAETQTGEVKITQKNYQFTPNLIAVRKGAKVEFPNQDDDYHHVFSYSKTREFDLGRYRKDEKQATVVFDKAGVVKVGCEIHEHMRATILVLENSHFTRTAPDGSYQLVLKNVPDGVYKLKAWLDERNVREQTVTIKEGGVLRVDFPGK